MNLENQARLFRKGLFIIFQMRPVGCPNFPQEGAAFLHDLRYAELAADFNEFPPGNDGFLSVRQGVDDQQDGRRVVVDDQGVFRAGQGAEKALYVIVAKPALALFEIEFQVGVSFADLDDPFQRFRTHRRPAEIGVQDDARGIDHPDQPVPEQRIYSAENLIGNLFR